MRVFSLLALITGAVALPSSLLQLRDEQNGTIVAPGGIEDIILTKESTLNGTYVSDTTQVVPASEMGASAAALPLKLYNNIGDGVKAYITGLDSSNRVVFIKSDGGVVYPSSGGSTTPKPIAEGIAIGLAGKGQTVTVNLKTPIHSGRIYFSKEPIKFFMQKGGAGDTLVQPNFTNNKDPNAAVHWGFVEFTYNADGSVYANISYVDFIGLITAGRLATSDGKADQVTKGLGPNGLNEVYFSLGTDVIIDGTHWEKMVYRAGSGEDPVLRVLSPNTYNKGVDGSLLDNYFKTYVDDVWKHYSTNTLTIDTQGHGKSSCKVSGGVLNCSGSNVGFNKPTSSDIWGCNSGPFVTNGQAVHDAIIPRLCAAFHRSTFLISDGNVQPGVGPDQYYQNFPTDEYCRVIKAREVDGKGYCFSYDDVNPAGGNSDGRLTSGQPKVLTFYVGGYPA